MDIVSLYMILNECKGFFNRAPALATVRPGAFRRTFCCVAGGGVVLCSYVVVGRGSGVVINISIFNQPWTNQLILSSN
jgi:hypothetical protein